MRNGLTHKQESNILLIRNIHDLSQGPEADCNHALGKCYTCAGPDVIGYRTAVDRKSSLFIEQSYIMKYCLLCRASENLKNL